jgi:hypothetical protein
MLRRRTQRCDLRRRLVVVLALAGYLTGTIGFPLPQLRSAPTAAGTTAAVRQHACGCVEVITEAPPSCCCSKAKAAAPSCCSETPAKPAAVAEEPAAPGRFTWIDSVSARECRGLGTSWLSVELSAPPPVQVEWSDFQEADSWIPESTFAPISRTLLPPTPPPR